MPLLPTDAFQRVHALRADPPPEVVGTIREDDGRLVFQPLGYGDEHYHDLGVLVARLQHRTDDEVLLVDNGAGIGFPECDAVRIGALRAAARSSCATRVIFTAGQSVNLIGVDERRIAAHVIVVGSHTGAPVYTVQIDTTTDAVFARGMEVAGVPAERLETR